MLKKGKCRKTNNCLWASSSSSCSERPSDVADVVVAKPCSSLGSGGCKNNAEKCMWLWGDKACVPRTSSEA
jgi:hypothetical protein